MSEASHWPFGIASTQPRQMSVRKAEVQKVSASQAAIQGSTSMPNSADAEEEQEQLHQQRRALEELDVPARQPLQPRISRDAREQQDERDDAAGDEGDQREQDGPARRQQQVGEDHPEGEIAHRLSWLYAFGNAQRPMPRRMARAAIASRR